MREGELREMKMLDNKGMEDMYGIKRSMLKYYRDRGMPYRQISERKIYYIQGEVEEWLYKFWNLDKKKLGKFK